VVDVAVEGLAQSIDKFCHARICSRIEVQLIIGLIERLEVIGQWRGEVPRRRN
jgi:hypothetical protein